jgi:hypothetical protein
MRIILIGQDYEVRFNCIGYKWHRWPGGGPQRQKDHAESRSQKKEVDRRPDVDAGKSGLVCLQTADAPRGIPRLSNRTLSAKRTWERIFGDWLGGGHWQYAFRLKESVCAASRVTMT